MNPTPLYTCFYTLGTIYEREAARLRRSLDALGLEHDLRGVADLGDWTRNAAMTAAHVVGMLEAYPDRPVIQLDADAVVWRRPALFDRLHGTADVALHRRRGVEWLNGTVYFAPTDAARAVARRYLDLIESDPGCTNEQTKLGRAVEELAGSFRLHPLPASYCWIHDVHTPDELAGEEPVIEHLQASRVANRSPMLPSRLRRLAELGE